MYLDDDTFSGIFVFIFGGPGLFMVVLGLILWLIDRRGAVDDSLNPPSGNRMIKAGTYLIAAAGRLSFSKRSS
jgi:hypothetical protein